MFYSLTVLKAPYLAYISKTNRKKKINLKKNPFLTSDLVCVIDQVTNCIVHVAEHLPVINGRKWYSSVGLLLGWIMLCCVRISINLLTFSKNKVHNKKACYTDKLRTYYYYH